MWRQRIFFVYGNMCRKGVQYESPIYSGLNDMANIRVLQKQVKVQGQGHKSEICSHVKGLVTRNIHVQSKSPIFLV